MIRDALRFGIMVGVLSGLAPRLQAQPSVTLTDFWNTNAIWVSDANSIGISFWFHYPSAITNGPETWAYYISGYYGPTGALKAVTSRARSMDGINWTNDGMVLNVGGAPQRVYESEGLPPADHEVGRTDGDGWSATRTLDFPGYLVRGPHAMSLPFTRHHGDQRKSAIIIRTLERCKNSTHQILRIEGPTGRGTINVTANGRE